MTPVFGRVIITPRHETHSHKKRKKQKKKGKNVQWPQGGAFALGCSKEPDKSTSPGWLSGHQRPETPCLSASGAFDNFGLDIKNFSSIREITS